MSIKYYLLVFNMKCRILFRKSRLFSRSAVLSLRLKAGVFFFTFPEFLSILLMIMKSIFWNIFSNIIYIYVYEYVSVYTLHVHIYIKSLKVIHAFHVSKGKEDWVFEFYSVFSHEMKKKDIGSNSAFRYLQKTPSKYWQESNTFVWGQH